MKALLAEAVANNILPVTGECNMNCVFCSHRFNPPLAQVYDLPPIPPELAGELTDALDPSSRIVIGESVTRLREGEPFTHPQILQILQNIREQFPRTPLQITTNGTLLTGSVMRFLSGLPPLELIISLNSSTGKGRRLLMGDHHPGKTTDAVSRLHEYGIAFHGSVVAMPGIAGWHDLEQTLKFLDKKGARTIRLFIPGFTRFTPENLYLSATDYQKMGVFISRMQETLSCPLLPEPPGVTDTEPVIEGIIKDSPASEAGLQRGDTVESVNGLRSRCRVEAFNMILKNADPRVVAGRGGEFIETVIKKEKNRTSGVTMLYDIEPSHIEKVTGYLNGGNFVLLMTSTAAAPLWETVKESYPASGLKIAAAPSLFWGGSICCAGLLTTGDFKEEIAGLPSNYKPDIIMLPPGAFDRRGKDITGRNCIELSAPLD